MPLLIGCGSTRTEYVTLHQPTDPNLLADVNIPIIPEPLTFGASMDLNIELLGRLGQCNVDKRALREIEALRAKQMLFLSN
ncbi:Rz1-like lysis system protein LysC [Thorsellia anophelis]|uniref:Rz1-like lysis system protein LysC n=1 Tax=Thorsellia anophelis TaxID=336804 RepID=UPI003CCBCA79